jgi:DNA-directed RNA polymerase I, II, and III subunit RPABC5
MVLADKYRYFQKEVRRIKLSRDLDVEKVIYLTKNNVEKTPEGEVLDELKLNNVCCRRHMLTHVDIE